MKDTSDLNDYIDRSAKKESGKDSQPGSSHISDANGNSKPSETKEGNYATSNETKSELATQSVRSLTQEGSPDISADISGNKHSKVDIKQTSANGKQVISEMESYRKLRQNLKQLVSRKIKIDRELENIEEKLAEKEDSYLNDASAGNLARGFDQYTKSSQNRRKSNVIEQDRIFTQSNTAFDAES